MFIYLYSLARKIPVLSNYIMYMYNIDVYVLNICICNIYIYVCIVCKTHA